jgi:hypothetical protein
MMFLIFLFLFIPLIFQIRVGNNAAFKFISIKFWQVCVLSIIGQMLMSILSSILMLKVLNHRGFRDGMPAVGIFMLGMLIMLVILIIIVIQLYAKYQDKEL